MNRQNSWFEITTYSADPTRIEMRRLSDEEAAAAAVNEAAELLKHWLEHAIQLIGLDVGVRLYTDTFKAEPAQVDLKAEARRRSKEDLRLKRKAMIKRGGR